MIADLPDELEREAAELDHLWEHLALGMADAKRDAAKRIRDALANEAPRLPPGPYC